MLKVYYVISLLLMVIGMIIMAEKARKKNTPLAGALVRLTYAVFLTVFSSAMAMMVQSEKLGKYAFLCCK